MKRLSIVIMVMLTAIFLNCSDSNKNNSNSVNNSNNTNDPSTNTGTEGSSDTGTNTDGNSDTGTNTDTQNNTDTATNKPNGNNLGKEASEIYLSAMIKLGNMVKDKPKASEIMDDVIKLKEETIQKLVKVGWKREDLNDDQKEYFTKSFMTKIWNVSKLDEYKYYQSAVMHYGVNDDNLSYLLSSFNILSQYAQFEELKVQSPKEAKRLGVIK